MLMFAFDTQQEEQQISLPYGCQRIARTNGNKGEWNDYNDYNHPVGRPSPYLHDQFPIKKQDISQTSDFPSSTPPPDCGVVDNTGLHLQLSINSERDLESKQRRD